MSLVFLLAAFGCSSDEPKGSLLLVSEASGVPQVWRHDLGGAARVVASGPEAMFAAAADPLGQHALVVSSSDGPQGHREALWLVPFDGSPRTSVAPAGGAVRNPAWAPDGSWVVFEADYASYRDLFRVDRDGSAMRRLTNQPFGSFEPNVSPDGAHLVFGTSRDGNAEVYRMTSDGRDPQRLTDHVADDVRPIWAPSGESLAWLSARGGPPRVWLMDPHGASARPLRALEGPTADRDFVWSPDGTRIAVVVQTEAGKLDIDVVDVASGKRLARLGGDGVDEQPAWSPDGRWLAYSASLQGEVEVVVASADGQRRLSVTDRPGADWLPRWMAP